MTIKGASHKGVPEGKNPAKPINSSPWFKCIFLENNIV